MPEEYYLLFRPWVETPNEHKEKIFNYLYNKALTGDFDNKPVEETDEMGIKY